MGKEVKYVVRLSSEERLSLETLVKTGKRAADTRLRAQILLKADVGEGGPGWADARIAAAFDVGLATVPRQRQRLVEEGLEAALTRKPSRQARLRRLDGEKEARLIAVAGAKAPEGYARWTMPLLADRLVELKVVDRISDETVRRTLKETYSSPGGIASGSSRQTTTRSSSPRGKTCLRSTIDRRTVNGPWGVSMSRPSDSSRRPAPRSRQPPAAPPHRITSPSAMGPPTCS
jgi:transposase